jgi:hypothetical protein
MSSRIEKMPGGLRLSGNKRNPALELRLGENDTREGGVALLEYIDTYLRKTKARLRDNETMAYGSWAIRFLARGDALLVHEYSPTPGNPTIVGASTAMTLWKLQLSACAKWGSLHLPPMLHQLVGVTVGVEEGEPLEGSRYEAPPHMSGWMLSTDRYNGDINTVRTVHLIHILTLRFDIGQFMALGPDFFFRKTAEGYFEVGKEEEEG